MKFYLEFFAKTLKIFFCHDYLSRNQKIKKNKRKWGIGSLTEKYILIWALSVETKVSIRRGRRLPFCIQSFYYWRGKDTHNLIFFEVRYKKRN